MTFLDFENSYQALIFLFLFSTTIDRAGTQRRTRHPQRPFLRRGPLHFCWPDKGQPRDLLDQERCDSAFPKQHVWYGSIFCQGTLLLFVVTLLFFFAKGLRPLFLLLALTVQYFHTPVLCALCSVLCSLFLSALGTSDVSCDNQDLIFAVSGNGSTFNTNSTTLLVPVRS